MVFIYIGKRILLSNIKIGLSYNICIGLIWKNVHWKILSSNFIALEYNCLNEIVQLQ